MSVIFVDGERLEVVDDFHKALLASGLFPPFYGRNYSALNDALTGLVELPLTIVWHRAQTSKERLGSDFDRLVSLMRNVEAETTDRQDRFRLDLRD